MNKTEADERWIGHSASGDDKAGLVLEGFTLPARVGSDRRAGRAEFSTRHIDDGRLRIEARPYGRGSKTVRLDVDLDVLYESLQKLGCHIDMSN